MFIVNRIRYPVLNIFTTDDGCDVLLISLFAIMNVIL